MNTNILAATAAAASLAVAACATTPFDRAVAVAKLEPTKGNATTGTVTFAQRLDKVYVTADVRGLTPGEHGFHMHEKGDCSSGDGMSTGGHWNPDGQPHGNHAGDFPVLFSKKGSSRITFFTDRFRADDVAGRTVIIHLNPDDYRSQPAGDSGLRIACGVINK